MINPSCHLIEEVLYNFSPEGGVRHPWMCCFTSAPSSGLYFYFYIPYPTSPVTQRKTPWRQNCKSNPRTCFPLTKIPQNLFIYFWQRAAAGPQTKLHVSAKKKKEPDLTKDLFYICLCVVLVFLSGDKLVAAVSQTPNCSHFQSANCGSQVPARLMWLTAFSVCNLHFLHCQKMWQWRGKKKNSYHYGRRADARHRIRRVAPLRCPHVASKLLSSFFPSAPFLSSSLSKQDVCVSAGQPGAERHKADDQIAALWSCPVLPGSAVAD